MGTGLRSLQILPCVIENIQQAGESARPGEEIRVSLYFERENGDPDNHIR